MAQVRTFAKLNVANALPEEKMAFIAVFYKGCYLHATQTNPDSSHLDRDVTRGFCASCGHVWVPNPNEEKCPNCGAPVLPCLAKSSCWHEKSKEMILRAFRKDGEFYVRKAIIRLTIDKTIDVQFEDEKVMEIGKTYPRFHVYHSLEASSDMVFELLDEYLSDDPTWNFLGEKLSVFDWNHVYFAFDAIACNPWILAAAKHKQKAMLSDDAYDAFRSIPEALKYSATEDEFLDKLEYPTALRPYWSVLGLSLPSRLGVPANEIPTALWNAVITAVLHKHLSKIDIPMAIACAFDCFDPNSVQPVVYTNPDFPNFLRKNALVCGAFTAKAFEELQYGKISIEEWNLNRFEKWIVKKSGMKRLENFEKNLKEGDMLKALEALL